MKIGIDSENPYRFRRLWNAVLIRFPKNKMKQKISASPRTVRGTATIHEDDRIEFRPYNEGESTQKNVRTTKGGKLFTTTSEKEPKQVAHLSCAADAADPYTEYVGQLAKLGIKPLTEQQMPAKQRLVAEGGIEVFLNAEKGVLTYQGSISLARSGNWQGELMRQLQVIVRTLPADKTFTSTVTKLKKESKR